MENFFTTYSVQIVSATVSLIVTIITTLLTHFLGNSKLLYAEKVKIVGELSKQKYDGIIELRKKIEVLSQYEDLALTEGKDNLIPEIKNARLYTPSSCYSFKAMSDFAMQLNDLYRQYGHCLRHTCVIHLIYIRNFFMEYSKFCKDYGISDEELRFISVPLYNGIHEWAKKFDHELIHSMNKPSTKYYSHSGFLYSLLIKIYGYIYKKSQPYMLVFNNNGIINTMFAQKENIKKEYEEYILENAEKIMMSRTYTQE